MSKTDLKQIAIAAMASVVGHFLYNMLSSEMAKWRGES